MATTKRKVTSIGNETRSNYIVLRHEPRTRQQ